MDEGGEEDRNGCAEDDLSAYDREVDVPSLIDDQIDEHYRNEIRGPTEEAEESVSKQKSEIAHRSVDPCKQEASDDKDRYDTENVGHQAVKRFCGWRREVDIKKLVLYLN